MKRIIAVLTLMFLLSLIVSPLTAAETRLVWTFYWEGLNVEIYAPYQAYPNDTITIRIRVEARENLEEVTVRLRIYGSKSEGYLGWYDSFYALNNVDLSSGTVEDQYFEVEIPEDVDPGLTYSQPSCSWKVWRGSSWQEQYKEGVFRLTYLRNKPYEDLQAAYNQLLADYNSLQTSYEDLQNNHNDLQADYSELLANYNSLQSSFNSLQDDYDSLNSTYLSLLSNYSSLQASFDEVRSKYEFAGETANALNLMYVFIETTVIFVATTIYYARSRIYSVLKKAKT